MTNDELRLLRCLEGPLYDPDLQRRCVNLCLALHAVVDALGERAVNEIELYASVVAQMRAEGQR